MRIVSAGHLCVDLAPEGLDGRIPSPGELHSVDALQVAIGGSVGNTGLALHRMGCDVGVDACIGDDSLGDLVERTLSVELGTEVRLTRTSERATAYSIVLDRPGVDRAFWHHVGANDGWIGPVERGADVYHIGYPSALPALARDKGAALGQLLSSLKSEKATVSMDLSAPATDELRALDWNGILRRHLPMVDLISPSLVDLQLLVPELSSATAADAARWLTRRGVGVALVTDGARGAAIDVGPATRVATGGVALSGLPGNYRAQVAPVRVPSVRTTGAGDVASAALIAAVANRLPVDQWGPFAMRVAGEHVSGKNPSGILL